MPVPLKRNYLWPEEFNITNTLGVIKDDAI